MEAWIGSIDGGTSNPAHQFLCAVEYAFRKELNTGNAHELDDTYNEKIRRVTVDDDDVQFNWMLVAVEIDVEKISDLIVNKWTTCGFSFADSIMEMYKISPKIKEFEAQYFTEVDINSVYNNYKEHKKQEEQCFIEVNNNNYIHFEIECTFTSFFWEEVHANHLFYDHGSS